MHAEYPAIDDGTERKVIKHLATVPPYARAPVLSHAFVVKAVHLRNLTALVVAPDERYSVRVPYFEREQQQKSFDAVEASVDVVA